MKGGTNMYSIGEFSKIGSVSTKTLRYYDEIYELDSEKVEEFDRKFLPKEKFTGFPSQKRFSELVSMNCPRE